ncbi:MFS transporter [Corynebacterium urealyticum]|uniref:MFS transporter n=1 Tax=Corynebacterium urealyticum TaxID=43771 RepID=A0A5D4FUD1_9CORY|nr:MFS transporter [Corynebacterium urealyticum]TYR19747.1 MFS transporter [Corynebacterium urealyticum]
MDLRQLIDNTRMSGYQWLIIAVAAFVNALDGYDLVAMAFSANAVTKEFDLSGSTLGWLLASALIGVGVGAVALAPLADRFGRKRLIVISLVITLAGLIATGFSSGVPELFVYRVITGIGVGGVLACVTVLTSEFSNLRFRGLAMAIYAAGYGLGASLCGTIASTLIPDHGWRVVFFAGAVLTTVALLAVLFFVPETPETLAARGDDAALQRLARRMGKVPAGAEDQQRVAVAVPSAAERGRARDLLGPELLRNTLLLWLGFALVNFGFNFANQWTPKLLTEVGLSEQLSTLGGIMLALGGTVGSVLFGVLTTRLSTRTTLVIFALTAGWVLVAFILSTDFPVLMLALGVAVGMLLNGCVTGMYTITPQSYAFHLRSTGVGIALGVGRIGAIMGPLVVGYLVDSGWSPLALYVGAAVVMLVVAVAIGAVQGPATLVAGRPGSVSTDRVSSDRD